MQKNINLSSLRPWQKEYIVNKKRFNVLVVHRRAGKTVGAVLDELIEAIKIQGDYGYIAPTYRQAKKIAWRLIQKFGDQIGDFKYNSSELIVTYTNGSTISLFGAENPDSLRGLDLRGVIFDEYAQQPSNIYSEIVFPMINANGGWVTWIGTPKGKNAFYQLYQRAIKDERFYTMLLRHTDTKLLSTEQIEDARKEMTEEEFEQEYNCFIPDTEIIGRNFVKEIKDIKVGDFVLTHSNRYRKVLNTMNREYSGEMYKIKVFGNNKEIICTPEHPIRVCNDGVNNVWKLAKDITKQDRLTINRVKENSIQNLNRGKTILLGWYIAEGSAGKNHVVFSLNENEIEYQDEIIDLLKQEYGLEGVKIFNGNGACSIQVNSQDLKEFYVSLCGSGAIEKRIPFEIIGGNELALLNTLINGDGCDIDGGYRYTTISKTLAYQMQILSGIVGYRSSVQVKKKPKDTIQGRLVNINIPYCVDIYFGKGDRIRKHKYNYSVGIRSIEKVYYEGLVYNFEVQHDNTYTANSIVVHNCSWEAYMRGSVYGKELSLAYAEGRVRKDVYDSNLPVTTFWDLGISDAMAILFTQTVGQEIRIIDHYTNTGYGLEHYANKLKEKEYKYNAHYFPHDIRNRELSTGLTRIETAVKLLGDICKIVPQNSVESGIDAGRMIFKNLWINEQLTDFINNLSLYQYEWDDKLGQFKKQPIHDFTSHDADAFRYLATIYNHLTKQPEKEEVIEKDITDDEIYGRDEITIDFEEIDSAY